jgi:CHASE2 domain-containing sensor protein
MTKLWFKRKAYGWGWTPSTWEGWLLIVTWAALTILLTKNIDQENYRLRLIGIGISIIILIKICYVRGELPRWTWGR